MAGYGLEMGRQTKVFFIGVFFRGLSIAFCGGLIVMDCALCFWVVASVSLWATRGQSAGCQQGNDKQEGK